MKYLYLFGFIETAYLANWMIGNIGNCDNGVCTIPVGFNLYAPSGVLAAGVAFTLRDLVQKEWGSKWAIMAVLIGAGLSALLSPLLALASGTAFLVSELLDMSVYTPLRERNFILAVSLSNTVGAIVDSWVFLTLAVIPLDFLLGQVVGKLWITIATAAILALWRNRAILRRA